MAERKNDYINRDKIWMKYYSEEAKNATLPECTAYNYLKQINSDRYNEPAIHYYGKDITFGELVDRIEATAQAFCAAGVRPGDIVSFLSVQIPETIAAIYALNKIGATANMIDPRMDISFIKRMIVNSGSKVFVTLDIAWPKVEQIKNLIDQDLIITQSAAASLPCIKKIAMKMATKTKIGYGEDVITWKEFIKRGEGVVAVEEPYVGDNAIAITYTGGTTGFPKGVVLTNDSVNAVVLNFRYCDVDYRDNDRYLGIIPVFSAYGLVCGMHMPFCMRCTLVPIPKFVPQQLGKLVRDFHPNHIISTPVFIELLIGSKEVANMDLSFLRTLASGGDSMNEGLEAKLNDFREKHGMKYPLAQGYGMSELSAAACFCVNRIYKKGSVGIPSLTTTIEIIDPETGKEVPIGKIGEVCVTGPSMMKCYFDAPEETANVMRLHEDGKVWIHAGDWGYMDEDGFVFIVGRIKRMITRFDGHKVFPVNLEGLIDARDDVKNVCVVGVNDLDHSQGQYPLVVVQLEGELSEEEKRAKCSDIFKQCEREVEERGKPVAVVAVDEMPLTPMGKNDYRAIGKTYKDFDYKSWVI